MFEKIFLILIFLILIGRMVKRKKFRKFLIPIISCVILYSLFFYYKKIDIENRTEGLKKENIIIEEKTDSKSSENKDSAVTENEELLYEVAILKKVIDGDTIEIKKDGVIKKVRLLMIDAPESVHQNSSKNGEFGKKASEFLKNYLNESLNKEIYLVKDISDVDKYNRLLRYVYVKKPSGDLKKSYLETANAHMLEEGYANFVTYPPDISLSKELLKLAKEARRNKRGLYALTEEINLQKAQQKINEEQKNPEHKIKGNKKTKIYHDINSSSYYNISEKNVIYFETEKEAIDAGYKKYK